MKRFIKKTIAVTSALAMTLSIAPAAFAATNTTGSYEGDSKLEGYLNKNVYDITVPTVAEKGIDFTVDPQGLLKVADSAKWSTGAGAVYFKNAPASDSAPATYSGKSDAITLINNSSFDIKVNCEVKVNTAGADVDMVEKTALAGDITKPSLYLGLISKTTDTEATVTVKSDGGKSAEVTLAKVAEKGASTPGYEVKASSSEVEGVTQSPNGYYYTYALSSDYVAATHGKAVSYYLEGACDSKADWSAIDTDIMSAQIVWTVTADELAEPEKTSIATAAYSRASTTNSYAITWGKDVPNESRTISKVEISTTSTMGSPTTVTTDAYSLSGNNLVINGTKAPIAAAAVGSKRYIRATFANGVKVVIEVTVEA